MGGLVIVERQQQRVYFCYTDDIRDNLLIVLACEA